MIHKQLARRGFMLENTASINAERLFLQTWKIDRHAHIVEQRQAFGYREVVVFMKLSERHMKSPGIKLISI
ncbi:hypothetical protein OPQ81_003612 [Rhizoctonia solani]|nr:hypothetical protein OPQ81_003612 [Rhizoctonia solani]